MSRIVRIAGLLALMLAMAAGLFAPKAEAAAGATVIAHVRGCYTGAYNEYEDCHDNGLAGVPIAFGGVDSVTDADGNAGWTSIPAGTYIFTMPDPYFSAVMSIYCQYDHSVGTAPYLDSLTVVDGDYIYCDIYLYLGDAPKKGDDGGKKHDGGTEMPDTGIGAAAAAGSLLPLALSGAVAAGLGLGVRRRKA